MFPTDYNKDLYRAHTEDLYKGLLVHLDDPSSLIQVCDQYNLFSSLCMEERALNMEATVLCLPQEAVLVVLKEASRLNPDLLRRQVEDVRHRHREDR